MNLFIYLFLLEKILGRLKLLLLCILDTQSYCLLFFDKENQGSNIYFLIIVTIKL